MVHTIGCSGRYGWRYGEKSRVFSEFSNVTAEFIQRYVTWYVIEFYMSVHVFRFYIDVCVLDNLILAHMHTCGTKLYRN